MLPDALGKAKNVMHGGEINFVVPVDQARTPVFSKSWCVVQLIYRHVCCIPFYFCTVKLSSCMCILSILVSYLFPINSFPKFLILFQQSPLHLGASSASGYVYI